MSDEKYVHGEMDISTQEKTFDGFMSTVVKAAIASILVLIFIGLVNG